jgi:hypothetical protein
MDGGAGDSTGFGEDFCTHDEEGSGPESFCTFQPDSVRVLVIVFQCAFPGLVSEGSHECVAAAAAAAAVDALAGRAHRSHRGVWGRGGACRLRH